jgi:hypothetical protein
MTPAFRTIPRPISLIVVVTILFIAATFAPAQTSPAARQPHKVGLGKVLTGALDGTIFDFDVDQNGTDGILDDAATLSDGSTKSAIETFDITTGKITKVIKTVVSASGDQELVTRGIAGDDIGFVDDERVHIGGGRVTRNDTFDLLNPLSGQQITGTWSVPDSKGALFWALAPNQLTTTQVAMVFRTENNNAVPWLYVTDLASNTILNVIKLPRYEDNFLLNLAQDSATNEAITNLNSSPGGPAPINVFIDLQTGETRQFDGFNNGFFGAGAVNALAVDSSTGILCTVTSLNSQVEFYQVSDGTGVWAQLPSTTNTNELDAGWAVTNDPVNHLFLIGQPFSSTGGGSAIYVYDEKGNLKETINGFNFPNSSFAGAINIAINPKLRAGWVNGPTFNNLQQFFY